MFFNLRIEICLFVKFLFYKVLIGIYGVICMWVLKYVCDFLFVGYDKIFEILVLIIF